MTCSGKYKSGLMGAPAWRDARGVCAFRDNERHLGHIVKVRGWHAFDATRFNDAGDAYRYLGVFPTKREAQDAVELSVALPGLQRAVVQ